MSRKDIENTVEKILTPLLTGSDMELVDVEYVRERNWILRIFIDKSSGVDLNDCQDISEKAGRLLDEADVIADNYMLEVSSPGIDRVLKKEKDFIRYAGEEVDVSLYAPSEKAKGQKIFTATLLGVTEEKNIRLSINEEESVWELSEISQMRLHFSF